MIQYTQSRKATPWDKVKELTPTQKFLKENYERFYSDRHRKISDSDEAEIVNSYPPSKCPFCKSETFKKFGHTKSEIQRYKCICGKTFLPTTGTIFDEHRISISEWMEYCLNLFHHVSINADSWSNKNDFKTSRYWLQKLFLTLEEIQDNIVLDGKIWLDETYYTVRSEDVVYNEDGTKLRGISKNKICIATATNRQKTILFIEGTGRPTKKKTLELFGSHIAKGATLIHDEDHAYSKLIEKLKLKSKAYNSKELRNLEDKDNPLNPVNRVHFLLKCFLDSHSGFKRENLQNYLNLFAFVSNPPHELLEKVELIVKIAFQNPKLLRFRKFYAPQSDS
jgi:transposase-like protein